MAPQANSQLLATDRSNSVLHQPADTGYHGVAYSPFGYHRPSPVALGFNGQSFEPAVQGYLLGNGYRLFSPVLGRFYCPDSFSPFGTALLNAYAYCQGDPVNRSDPSGHLPGWLYQLASRLRRNLNGVPEASNSASRVISAASELHSPQHYEALARPLRARFAAVRTQRRTLEKLHPFSAEHAQAIQIGIRQSRAEMTSLRGEITSLDRQYRAARNRYRALQPPSGASLGPPSYEHLSPPRYEDVFPPRYAELQLTPAPRSMGLTASQKNQRLRNTRPQAD
jgi:RHS repeat-associated protein